MSKLLFAGATVLVLGLSLYSKAQASASECDFSSYKPLIISDALLNSVVKRVKPESPGTAMRVSRSEAKVRVKILVDRAGNVDEACATDGHPLLREAARQAALQWKFKRNFGSARIPKRKYAQSFIIFTFKFK
jgi:hypothetical protein